VRKGVKSTSETGEGSMAGGGVKREEGKIANGNTKARNRGGAWTVKILQGEITMRRGRRRRGRRAKEQT